MNDAAVGGGRDAAGRAAVADLGACGDPWGPPTPIGVSVWAKPSVPGSRLDGTVGASAVLIISVAAFESPVTAERFDLEWAAFRSSAGASVANQVGESQFKPVRPPRVGLDSRAAVAEVGDARILLIGAYDASFVYAIAVVSQNASAPARADVWRAVEAMVEPTQYDRLPEGMADTMLGAVGLSADADGGSLLARLPGVADLPSGYQSLGEDVLLA